RAPRAERRRPADVIHQLGKIIGKKLDRKGAARLVRAAVAATVVGEHGGLGCESLGNRAPERAIHGDRMNQDGPALRVPVAVEAIGDPRSVAGRRQLDTHWKCPFFLLGLACSAEFSRIQWAASKGSGLADECRNARAEGGGPERPAKVARAPLGLADYLIKRSLDGVGRAREPRVLTPLTEP